MLHVHPTELLGLSISGVSFQVMDKLEMKFLKCLEAWLGNHHGLRLDLPRLRYSMVALDAVYILRSHRVAHALRGTV